MRRVNRPRLLGSVQFLALRLAAEQEIVGGFDINRFLNPYIGRRQYKYDTAFKRLTEKRYLIEAGYRASNRPGKRALVYRLTPLGRKALHTQQELFRSIERP